MWKKLKELIDERLIRPIRDSHAPSGELALGTAVGLFWALTPLVGVQMLLTTATWALFKGTKRLRFNLAVALAWVWITNPVTMPIFYYTFYMVGYYVFLLFDPALQIISFHLFETTIHQANEMNMWDGVMHWVRFILNDLGWPMVVGSAFTAIPIAVFSFPLSRRGINRYRTRVAGQKGLTLQEWEEIYVYHTRKPMDHDSHDDTPGHPLDRSAGEAGKQSSGDKNSPLAMSKAS